MINFLRHLLRLINKIKGGNPMQEENKPNDPRQPRRRPTFDSDKPQGDTSQEGKKKPLVDGKDKFDKNGNLFIKLTMDDSALVVRANGTVELVSHDLENSDDGYVGDVEDLNKTFSLVLALASALENEDLYNRIFHNLNMTLMKKWDNMPDELKAEITKKRQAKNQSRNTEEEQEKRDRVDEFRKRMNKYKETFLDDLEAEKEKLKKDLRDEEDFHRRYGHQFGNEAEEHDPFMPGEMDDFFMGGRPDSGMESRPRMKRKKPNPLGRLRNTEWNPYDDTLKTHGFNYRLDVPPDEEDE